MYTTGQPRLGSVWTITGNWCLLSLKSPLGSEAESLWKGGFVGNASRSVRKQEAIRLSGRTLCANRSSCGVTVEVDPDGDGRGRRGAKEHAVNPIMPLAASSARRLAKGVIAVEKVAASACQRRPFAQRSYGPGNPTAHKETNY
jgi:hypothetical protein